MICRGGDCPEAVASFISQASSDNIHLKILCSSTLIAENKIITNLHCLREDQKLAQADCRSTSEVQFPETKNFAAETYACKKIVQVDSSDWAVVEFDGKSKRAPQVLSEARIELGESIVAYPIFYNDFFPIGEIRSVTCSSAELGYMDYDTFHPESRNFFATNCSEPIKVGNSGTSFYSLNGQFVGLLNSASHHAYVSDAEVLANGSTSIRGLKSACIAYNKRIDSICDWSNLEGFPNLAVDFSTLISFAKKVTATTKPLSRWLYWREADSGLDLDYFTALYPYTTIKNSEDFLKQNNRGDILIELLGLVAQVIQWQPDCVYSKEVLLRGVMPYTILNYHNNSIYPNESGGFYLSVFDDLQLSLSVHSLELPVEAQFDPAKNRYVVSYHKSEDPFALTADEQKTFDQCVRDGAAKVNACKDQGCATAVEELLKAPLECETVFKKRSRSHYLQPFQFEVPRCRKLSPFSH